MIVSVIGAAGHVGLPFSLVLAEAGYTVFGIDTNEELVVKLNNGILPYQEEGAQALLSKALRKRDQSPWTPGSILFMDTYSNLEISDVIAIMMGTPVDEEGNPRLDGILNFVSNVLILELKKVPTNIPLIMLRSTVSPGTTEIIKDLLEKGLDKKEGQGFHLVFCPERVAQGVGIKEAKKFPQLIGAFSELSFTVAANFFGQFVEKTSIYLTPREAELGKLMTNMWRFITFALANEFYMIGQKQNVDIHKIIDAINLDYPRMNLPKPGPNVGGPCLFKDGKFLLDDVPYSDLIRTSFDINEGMPDYIYSIIKEKVTNPKLAIILGATFKADSDDIRQSLSYKMRKVLIKHGVESFMIDGIDPKLLKNKSSKVNSEDVDVIILMTPHFQFYDWLSTRSSPFRDDCLVIDIWKYLDKSKQTKTGIYYIKDVR